MVVYSKSADLHSAGRRLITKRMITPDAALGKVIGGKTTMFKMNKSAWPFRTSEIRRRTPRHVVEMDACQFSAAPDVYLDDRTAFLWPTSFSEWHGARTPIAQGALQAREVSAHTRVRVAVGVAGASALRRLASRTDRATWHGGAALLKRPGVGIFDCIVRQESWQARTFDSNGALFQTLCTG